MVIASTACMNAMLAPAVTMMRLPRPTSMPFSRRSLPAIASTQRRQAGAVVVFVGRRVAPAPSRTASSASRRRAVVHDALAERDGAGRLANQRADDRDDGRLDRVHPRARARAVSRPWLIEAQRAGLFLLS